MKIIIEKKSNSWINSIKLWEPPNWNIKKRNFVDKLKPSKKDQEIKMEIHENRRKSKNIEKERLKGKQERKVVENKKKINQIVWSKNGCKKWKI